LIVEAPTAEAALEVVADKLGTRARIAGVERVRRGGVGGFFARELVQVTATGQDAAHAATPAPAPPEEPRSAVDRLLRQIAERDDPFAATLQRQLAPATSDDAGTATGDAPAQDATEPVRPPAAEDAADDARAAGPAVAEPVAPPPAQDPPVRSWTGLRTADAASPAAARFPWAQHPPVPATPAPNGGPAAPRAGARVPLAGTPQWSVRNLCRLGLPPLVPGDEAARLAPDDDLGWTHAVAASLQPLCGPLPDGPTIVVGPAAERLAGVLDLAVHWPGQPTPPESFIAPISGRSAERTWLASVRERRPLHLVVGGPAWRALLFDDPVVLSHTDATLCDAVSLAFQLGITFGYTCHSWGETTRTNPIDLAVAIRRLLPTYS
jgi:hypothetical protein